MTIERFERCEHGTPEIEACGLCTIKGWNMEAKYADLKRLHEVVCRISRERNLPWYDRPWDEIPEAEKAGMADAIAEVFARPEATRTSVLEEAAKECDALGRTAPNTQRGFAYGIAAKCIRDLKRDEAPPLTSSPQASVERRCPRCGVAEGRECLDYDHAAQRCNNLEQTPQLDQHK